MLDIVDCYCEGSPAPSTNCGLLLKDGKPRDKRRKHLDSGQTKTFPKPWGWSLQKISLLEKKKKWLFWVKAIFVSRKKFWRSPQQKNHRWLLKSPSTTIFWRLHSIGKDVFWCFGFNGFPRHNLVSGCFSLGLAKESAANRGGGGGGLFLYVYIYTHRGGH